LEDLSINNKISAHYTKICKMSEQSPTCPGHFALVVYPHFEVLDAFGPTEVLHCLGHPVVNHDAEKITLSIIGPSLDPVSSGPAEGDPSPIKSRVSQTIVPTHTFDNPPKDIDVLIVPGGFGAGPKTLFGGEWEPAGVERVVQFLRDQYPSLQNLLSKWLLQHLSELRLTSMVRQLFATALVLPLGLEYWTVTKRLRTNSCGARLLLPGRRRIGQRRLGMSILLLPGNRLYDVLT
jgi:hypothetical protein